MVVYSHRGRGAPWRGSQVLAPLALWAFVSTGSKEHSLQLLQYGSCDIWHSWEDDSTHSAPAAILDAWREGCYPGNLPPALDFYGTMYLNIGHRTSSMLLYDLCKTAYGLKEDDMAAKSDLNRYFPSSCADLASQPGRLMAFTQYIQLPLKKVPKDNYREGSFWLYNAERRPTIFIDCDYAHLARLDEISSQTPNATVHVIALSLGEDGPKIRDDLNKKMEEMDQDSTNSHNSARKFSFWDELESKNYYCFDCYGKKRKEFTINVMIVEINGGICKRLAIGKAYLRWWAKQSPKFSTFVLE
ncbi:hypothetical protein AWENTII_000772 [Aspergillus wentii]